MVPRGLGDVIRNYQHRERKKYRERRRLFPHRLNFPATMLSLYIVLAIGAQCTDSCSFPCLKVSNNPQNPWTGLFSATHGPYLVNREPYVQYCIREHDLRVKSWSSYQCSHTLSKSRAEQPQLLHQMSKPSVLEKF